MEQILYMEVIFQLPVLGLFPKLIRYLWQSVSELLRAVSQSGDLITEQRNMTEYDRHTVIL